MFATRFFPDRYFAPRYFAKVGANFTAGTRPGKVSGGSAPLDGRAGSSARKGSAAGASVATGKVVKL